MYISLFNLLVSVVFCELSKPSFHVRAIKGWSSYVTVNILYVLCAELMANFM